MSLQNDLINETSEIVRSAWDKRDGKVVPEPEDLSLKNEAVNLEATFLYADLADSTEAAIQKQESAAELFKAYLRGTTRIIRSLGGEIRSFDGDRVMGVFFDGPKNTNAAEAALKIAYFFEKILKPTFVSFYGDHFSTLKQTVGVDTSKVMVIRGGIRDNNDLVWVGRAPNIAAKLSAIREAGYHSYITSTVFNVMLDTSKYSIEDHRLMWESRSWPKGKAYGVETVYRSSWIWPV